MDGPSRGLLPVCNGDWNRKIFSVLDGLAQRTASVVIGLAQGTASEWNGGLEHGNFSVVVVCVCSND